MNKEAFGKFAKGFASGGGAALLAFLTTNGCQVTDLKAFGLSAALAVISGAFHALWFLFFHAPVSPSSAE